MGVLNNILTGFVNPLIGLLFSVAIAIFIWGVIGFIFNSDNENNRADGKKHIIWGLVGLFIMFAVRGIIALIKNFLGITN